LGEAEDTARADDVMTMLTHIATVTGMKAAVTHSCRGAAVASPFIIVCGMLFGPVGIFIGGALGGLIAWMTSEDFKSVPQVLMELSPAERQKLCAEAMAVVQNFDWKDAAELIKFVMSNSFIRDKVLGVLNTYVTNKLKAKPKYTK
ncbi:protein C19orf12 homolog, partial [Pyrgilauda ruficollis]|uniref:protein C19orf12 homolog n=1 Tax=Pyrgilauda ruficollis TaxID=221976 RepID=UPI001B864B38